MERSPLGVSVGPGTRPTASGGGERPVALFLPTLACGGAEINLVRLSGELPRHGFESKIVVASATGPLGERVPQAVEVVDLGARRARAALGSLARYLRHEPPAVLLSSVEHGSVVALMARELSGAPTRVVVRVATSLVADGGLGVTSKLARRLYPRADGLVVNAAGAADELAGFLRLPRGRITVLPNLTVGARMTETAGPPPHPWLQAGGPPVIVSVGRLHAVKNPDLLLGAFAGLRKRRAARLLFIGDGPLRAALLASAARLGVASHVDLVGSVPDPAAYVRHARVFCLASDTEGMPNAMIEAMACGVGIVATDCGHGPRELLAGGRHGRLIPRRDLPAMTHALDLALDDPRPAPYEAWSAHTITNAGAAYAHYLESVMAGR